MKNKLLLIALFLFSNALLAQTVHWNALFANNHTNQDSVYNGDYSLGATANDLADLLNQATGSTTFSSGFFYGTLATSGIVLFIDSTLDNSQRLQSCSLTTNGINRIVFTASSSDGVRFGVYSFLAELGFRFYAPTSLWQITPSIGNVFASVTQNKNYITKREVHSWFGQGGTGSAPIIDSTGEVTKQAWKIYQERNNMVDEYFQTGHEGEAWLAANNSILQANPCWIAEHDSSHALVQGAVPSIRVDSAMVNFARFAAFDPFNFYSSLWPGNINYYSKIRNIKSRYKISLEAADGARWGNTTFTNCPSGSWPSESDQQFTIANFGTSYLQGMLPFDFRTTCYAYGRHSAPPSFPLNSSIQIGVANDFLTGTTLNAQLHRWHGIHPYIFEYDYLNMPYGSWGTPYASIKYMNSQTKRINSWNTLGALYESGRSVFAAALYMYPFQKSMMDGSDYVPNFNTMISDLFPGSSPSIEKLFNHWGNYNNVFTADVLFENYRRYPLYLSFIDSASQTATNAKEIQRIRMLKAYMHYLILVSDAQFCSPIQKDYNVRILCKYMAKTWLTNIIASYQQFNAVISDPAVSPALLNEWITQIVDPNDTIPPFDIVGFELKAQNFIDNPPITDNEIDANFIADMARYPVSCQYSFTEPSEIVNQACQANLVPKDTINVTLFQYALSTDYSLIALENGSVRVKYSISNDSPAKQIRLTLDAADQTYSETQNTDIAQQSGTVDFQIPAAGEYTLTFVYTGTLMADISIITNNNYFFKPFVTFPLLNEKYKDSLSIPRYIYVPKDLNNLYYSISGVGNNLTAASKFVFTNPNGIVVNPSISTFDSTTYQITIDSTVTGSFWQLYPDTLCGTAFSLMNTQNVELYLQPGGCTLLNVKKLHEIDFQVSPNPGTGLFTLNMKAEGGVNATVFNITGQKCFSHQYAKWNGKDELDLSSLRPGMYFVRIENNGLYSTKKIVIAR